MKILFYNCSETILVFGLLANSVISFDLSALVQFIVALMLSQSLASQADNVKYKNVLVWIMFVTSVIAIILKAALVALGAASASQGLSPKQISVLESVGCRFQEGKPGASAIVNMLRADVICITICVLYFLFLRSLSKAHQGKLRIQRTLTRILPASRQRAMA